MYQPQFTPTFDGWRTAARELLNNQVSPNEVRWSEEPSLFQVESTVLPKSTSTLSTVPASFIKLAKSVACARDEDRWDLLYRILFRLRTENPNLMEISVDADIRRAELLVKSVRRDIHKMHAFVRFKKTIFNNEEIYVAWHQPEHLILREGAEFFARRFGDKRWSIWTPDESAHWDLAKINFGQGMAQSEFAVKDDWEDLWKTYYSSIFNPARIKIKAMKLEMSPKYWSSMPETALIKDLIREAPSRLQTMAINHNRAAIIERDLTLPELRAQAMGCTACPLYAGATQTVFGVGPEDAKIMIVGEQPGDQEDLQGMPFIGPAGEILEEALNTAGLLRNEIYLTNAVKHFKYVRNGKFRKHAKASGSEMHACKPWLDAEIEKIKPRVIIALGTTAANAIIGRLPRLADERGKPITNLSLAPNVLMSWHPAAILRSFSPEESALRREQLAADLILGKSLIA